MSALKNTDEQNVMTKHLLSNKTFSLNKKTFSFSLVPNWERSQEYFISLLLLQEMGVAEYQRSSSLFANLL